MPREVHAGKLLSLDHGILVRVGSRDAEDRFTAEDLRASLKERGIPSRATGPVVELLRTNTASARTLLAAAHVTFDPAMHDEGYVILPRARGLAVIAATSTGLFYGAQTVKQLVMDGDMAMRRWQGRPASDRHHPDRHTSRHQTGPRFRIAASTTISRAVPSLHSSSRSARSALSPLISSTSTRPISSTRSPIRPRRSWRHPAGP